MRIRSIKPEFWRSSDITSLAIEDRLLFIGLWSYVDDNGVGRGEEASIVGDLFAADMFANPRETVARVSRGLLKLSESNLIKRYEVAGKQYLQICAWDSHQRIDKPGKPRFPRYDADSRDTRETLATVSEKVAPGTGEQGNRGTGEQGSSITSSLAASEFDVAYSHWPKKVERKKSFDAFKRAAKKYPVADLVDDIIRFGDAYAATTERQFVPALNVWLNAERWTDELPQANRQRTKNDHNLSVVEKYRQLEMQNRMEISA